MIIPSCYWFLLLCVVSGVVAWCCTAILLKYSVRFRLVQHPNDRSSHVNPTPTGGGVSFIIATLLLAFFLVFLRLGEYPFIWGLLILSLPLALIGLWDDISGASVLLRLILQFLVLLIFVAFFEPVTLGAFIKFKNWPTWSLYGLSMLIILVGIWWINLYNFMDGIDGIASTQAIFMLLAGCGLAFTFHPQVFLHHAWWWVGSIVCCALIGFLSWNWSPAKIFMGDVGSTWLSFVIFILAFNAVQFQTMHTVTWLILAAVFVVDSSVTLGIRLLSKERIFSAHRSHVYQRLSRKLTDRTMAHRLVCGLYALVNVLWLLPLAYASMAHKSLWLLWLLLAYVPLIIAALLLRAGQPER